LVIAQSESRKIDLSYFDSDTLLLQGHFILKTATLSYSQRLKSTNDIVGSASMVQTTNNGVASMHPLFSISIQHRFFLRARTSATGRHGMIQGHIFRDDDSPDFTARSVRQWAVWKCVWMRTASTRTDASGYYSFHHVPFGVHRVEAKLKKRRAVLLHHGFTRHRGHDATADFSHQLRQRTDLRVPAHDSRRRHQWNHGGVKAEKFTRRVQTA